MSNPDSLDSARGTAFAILQQSRRKQGFAAELIDQQLQASSLVGPDRGLVTQLVFGVLRRRAGLDALLIPFINRSPDQVQSGIWDVLHLGAYQLAFLSHIPPHAAVHESVDLVARFNGAAKGFVNGILRRVSEIITSDFQDRPAADAIPFENGQYRRLQKALLPDPAKKPTEYLKNGFSWPHWMAARWLKRYGWDECVRLGFWFLASPSLWLRCNGLKVTRDDYLRQLSEAGIGADPGPHPQSVRLHSHHSIRALPGYEAGAFAVQDESAMRVASALSPEPGAGVLDLCSAPGGKTTHLAELMRNQGQILACDIEEDRLSTVSSLCRRLGIQIVKTHLLDATDAVPRGPFDAILLDVPCSNTGVMGRRPEVRWRLTPTDFEHLVRLQTRLLRQAGHQLRPGGAMVYSTCSVEPEENEQLVAGVLRERTDLLLEEERLSRPGDPADGGYWARIRKHAGKVLA